MTKLERTRGESELTLLKRLLSAWRETRAPELEPKIDKAGWAVAYGRGTIRDEARWHEVAAAADPGDVDRLLDAVWPKSVVAAHERVRKLATLPPDPRISAKVAAVARTYVGEDSRELHRAIAALLVRAPSARLLPAIDAIEAARGHMTHTLYADARRLIAVMSPAAPDPTLVEAAAERLGDDAGLDELFAQVAEHPTDLERRAVLADRLQQAGDPRGEFITLQLAEETPAIRRRIAKLLEVHADAWTGPLPGVDRSWREFERGFLVAAHVELYPEQLARSLDRPEWATIETLSVSGTAGDVAGLVARMPALRCFAGPRWAVDAIVKAGGIPTLRTLVVQGDSIAPDRASFPALEVLLVETDREATRLLRELQLRAIGFVNCAVRDLDRFVRAQRTELRLTFGWSHGRLPLPGWHAIIAADRSSAELRFAAGQRHRRLVREIVDTLAAVGVKDIAICNATAAVKGLLRGATVRHVDHAFDILR